jgi:hypothetical protein
MTLHALSRTLEVHSGDYHVRFGQPTIEIIEDPADLPEGFGSPRATVLRVPLNEGALEASDLMNWAERWDASGLLFLAHVATIRFVAEDRKLSLQLDWEDRPGSTVRTDTGEFPVIRRQARCGDGRAWSVHSAELPSPSNARRAHKATGETTPIAVALSLFSEAAGELYASLPVATIDRPLRASAQFDPTAGRQGFTPTEWNRALVVLIAGLWAKAVLDLFADDPRRAWPMIPVPPQRQLSGIVGDLELGLLKEARNVVAKDLHFAVEGASFWIGDLAVEVPALTELLTSSEIAGLAGLGATLPTACRDEAGTFLRVLDDWRANGTLIAPLVTVLDALNLIEEASRDPENSIALAAAAIDAGLDMQLAKKAFVVARDGSRVPAPKGTDMTALVEHPKDLAVQLGLGTVIHSTHFEDGASATKVRAWLSERGALIDSSDVRALLGRIADSASRGWRWKRPFTDDRLLAVRDALERLDEKDWVRLGSGIGRAMKLDGFHYERGHRVEVAVSPASAYLSKSIDRDQESFALAAATTPGIMWLAGRYATVLKSSLGRTGLGAQRFLRLLGAETAPRLIPHPGLDFRYSGQRPGVYLYVDGGSAARVTALQRLGATYTLDDVSSPDLDRVLCDIATDRKATRRRSRASAIVAILGRSSQVFGEQASVWAAEDYRRWQWKEKTKSWWIWQAATIPWLDDASAKPRSPLELRIKTTATIAVHGVHAEGYLHQFFKACRQDVLLALGVAGEPSMGDLCQRLRQLRDGEQGTANIAGECAVIYRALGARLAAPVPLPGDLNREQLQAAFSGGPGLVFTNGRWLPPSSVFNGAPVFGQLRHFIPTISGAERLWSALQIRAPSSDDCISVLAELAKTRRPPDTDARAVMLDTLRVMLRLLEKRPTNEQLLHRLSRVGDLIVPSTRLMILHWLPVLRSTCPSGNRGVRWPSLSPYSTYSRYEVCRPMLEPSSPLMIRRPMKCPQICLRRQSSSWPKT